MPQSPCPHTRRCYQTLEKVIVGFVNFEKNILQIQKLYYICIASGTSRRASLRGGLILHHSALFLCPYLNELAMYLCYIDESGTPEVPGTTSHYVLTGLAIPIYRWNVCEREINDVKRKYWLQDHEIHTGWLLRNYTEQNKIPNFESLSYAQRRSAVEQMRRAELLSLNRRGGNSAKIKQLKKNYEKTKAYIHLTFAERKSFVLEIATTIGNWGFARLFCECVDKIFFDPSRAPRPVDEQALEQVISRFQHYLAGLSGEKQYGLLIHDNNQTVAKRHTSLMKHFHQAGTFWTQIYNIIETPLFVDSTLTSMIQIADVCAYAIRRYLENNEDILFNQVFKRVDRKGNLTVGMRHFSNTNCSCSICQTHKFTV